MPQIDALKASILLYINNFGLYDYVGYALLILLFFIIILVSILLAKKSIISSLLMLVISFVVLFVGPFVLKSYLDDYLRPIQINTQMVKKLTFSDALVVTGDLTNTSKKNYSTCKVKISVLKQGSNKIKNLVNGLKPLRKKTIFINEPVDVNMTEDFRVVFDSYTYTKDINVSVDAECY